MRTKHSRLGARFAVAFLLAGLCAWAPAAAAELLLRVACFAGGRDQLGLPRAGQVLAQEALTDYLANWNPESDNEEVEELFALHDVVEIARIARRLPEKGGPALATVSVGEVTWALRFEVAPRGRRREIAVEIWRDQERIFSPVTVVELGERAIVSGTDVSSVPFLWLALEITKLSDTDLAALERSPSSAVPTVDGDVIRLPQRNFFPTVPYTDEARAARIQGIVLLDVVVDETGRVGDIRVLNPLPMGLTEAAVEAVSRSRFDPPRRDGRPVRARFVLTVQFRLDSDGFQAP